MIGPVLLTREHDVSLFDCGKEALDTFLKRHASINAANDSARTFVALDDGNEGRVVGYYSLAASSAFYDEAPERVRKGLARHAVPAILMARFAVDRECQGRGIGGGLLKDAFERVHYVSRENVAARMFVVDAKDEEAARFYLRFGMTRFSPDSPRLYMLMKDIERTLRPA